MKKLILSVILSLIFTFSNVAFADTGTLKVQTAHIILTSAQILTLKATPIEIIPAQGTGKIIKPLGFSMQLNYNSIAYVGTGGLSLAYNSYGTNMFNASSGCITPTVSTFCSYSQQNQLPALSLVSNTNMIVKNAGASEFTTGNSTIDVWVQYVVLNGSTYDTEPTYGCTSFSCLTDIPTTISGYGITDSFALPTQTDNSGKFLTTDGVYPSWATVTGGTTTGDVNVTATMELDPALIWIFEFFVFFLLFGLTVNFIIKYLRKL